MERIFCGYWRIYLVRILINYYKISSFWRHSVWNWRIWLVNKSA